MTGDVYSRAWAALIDRYGAAVVDEYGDSPPEHWRAAIDRLAPHELQEALRRLRDDPPARRPNALEFSELARGRPTTYRGPPPRQRADYHPAPPARVDQHLARIRSRLRGAAAGAADTDHAPDGWAEP